MITDLRNAGRGDRFADPYLAGLGLGLTLLASFVTTGRGLGASGAFATSAAGLVSAIAPRQAAANHYFARYLAGEGPWLDWLLLEIGGVFIGAFLSALVAGRVRLMIECGSATAPSTRLACAMGGGLFMGGGAVLARGCTSGLGLTGGALLSVGSWLFILAAFGAAYLATPLVKRIWQ